ncbi:MAG: DsbA family protein [Chloroflexota bacterium]|nr:DsbA family protein [Chloroflexota bacterium]
MIQKVNNSNVRARIAVSVIMLIVVGFLGSCVLPGAPTGNSTVPTSTGLITETITATTPVTTNATVTMAAAITATASLTPTTAPTTSTGAAATGIQEKYKDLPVGFTSEGFAYRGNPDAPITMIEFSDYQCPFCSRYFIETEPAINESYVRNGQVRVIFRDFPLEQLHPNAPAAHAAALCVADQGAAAFWSMHDQLFQTQAQWQALPDPNPYFAQLAATIGTDVDLYNTCVGEGAKTAIIEASLAEGQALGFSGTPSFHFIRAATDETFQLVGAQPYAQFASLLDALVAGESPEQATEPEPGSDEIPFWATAEGLTPNPEQPGYTAAGDPYRGNPEAKVVVVEFSDFQCPFCRRHSEDTQPALDETFVATDQIMWVFKNFPLDIHPQAPAAAVAAECAGDQGKFWEMHALLFANVAAWSISDPNSVLSDLAQQLALDADQFSACLSGEEAAQRVESDMADGTQFVQGTPTFIVLFNGEGRIIPGALPIDRFTTALQEVLDSVVE